MTQPPEPVPGAPTEPTTAPPVDQPQPTDPGLDPHAPVDIDSLPPNVKSLITNLRKEAGASRTNAKTKAAEEAKAELWSQITQALGVEEQPADPAALAEQLQSTQAAEASARLEYDVYRRAVRLGVNAERLLDSLAFREEVDAIDADADFMAEVEKLIKARLDADPALRANGAAAATSHRPVEALQPGAMPNAPEPNLEDQIQAAQNAGNWREVIRLNGIKAAAVSK